MFLHHLETRAACNPWANARSCDACADLSDATRKQNFKAFCVLLDEFSALTARIGPTGQHFAAREQGAWTFQF
ncbi:MAG: hypothetical protein J4G15_05040 [Alphaproteobacteria bacterium]|nr:hypothetical protein [Alphaproteobacteria bacterium]